MKRIIFTVTNDLNYDQRMIRICSSLQKAGYQVSLVGRIKKKSPALAPQIFHQKRLYCFFQKGKFFYLEYNLRLFLYLLFKKTNALCAIDLDTIMPVYLTGKLKSNTLIYDAHEYFTEVPEVIRRPKIKKIWSWVARTFIPKMDLCYTVGPQLAYILSKEYGKAFDVIKNVPFKSKAEVMEKEGKEDSKDNFILLYQGALNEGRGLEIAIQAIKDLPKHNKLWLAGEGDLSNKLRKQVQELDLSDRIKFYGYLSPNELKALTPKADLGLNLLENKGLSYYYSLANKCFDYIQAGVPAINMQFPEYEALQDQFACLLLLEKVDAKQIRNLILDFQQNQNLQSQLKQNCRKAAALLNWELEEEKLIHMYQAIC